jgi:hypothetical protein
MLTYLLYSLLAVVNMTQVQTSDFKSVTFESMTRGGNRLVEVRADSIVLMKSREKRTFKTDKVDWLKITKIVQALKLNEIETYPAPTSKRSYDGAWHSTIRVVDANDKHYSSNSFDDEVAPKELLSLMKRLKEIETQYSKKK